MMKAEPDESVINAAIRERFDAFLRFAFAELEGGKAYQHNWHIDAIQYELERIRLGHNRRLIVTVPPRHLKSVTISVAWVAWMLGRDPSLRFICASYGSDLAEGFGRDCLRIMQSEWYGRAFPSLKFSRRTVYDFRTTAGGGRLSTSVEGVVTGLGANIVIVDDPLKANAATSEAERTATKDWFDNSLRSRLENQAKGSFIVVAQRLHEDDLPGALLRDGGWTELKLSAIATHDELIPLTHGRYHQRRAGHALHESRLPLAELERLRAENPFVFSPQWQQEPLARIGAFVQPESFGRYDDRPTSGIIIQSWDTAVKTTVRNDWSVGITACFYQSRFYILDVFRKRVEFSQLEASLHNLCRSHGVGRLLIEDASSGQQLIQRLREGPPQGVPLPIAIKSSTDKISRFEAQASKIQAGTVVLPRTAPWIADFLNEVCGFPNARHDDQADALAQMLANPPLQLSTPNAGPELVEISDYEPAWDEPEQDWPEAELDPWA
ncbi:MAG: phage terminase large subunit [Pseudomonadota bacterium]